MATINNWSNTITAASTITSSTTNGAIVMNSGTGTISIGTDATAATYNIATGAGAKVVTLGTTNTTSSLALQCGTADFTLASATGTIMSALDTGEITRSKQVAFLAYLPSSSADRTGNGATYTLGNAAALTEVYDQNGDFTTNGNFTAPVTGRYKFDATIFATGCTVASSWTTTLLTSNRIYTTIKTRTASADSASGNISVEADLDAADVGSARLSVSGESANTVDIDGSANAYSFIAGYLIC